LQLGSSRIFDFAFGILQQTGINLNRFIQRDLVLECLLNLKSTLFL
jgi:hypothetical protein